VVVLRRKSTFWRGLLRILSLNQRSVDAGDRWPAGERHVEIKLIAQESEQVLDPFLPTGTAAR
jgi:hypothetical protein